MSQNKTDGTTFCRFSGLSCALPSELPPKSMPSPSGIPLKAASRISCNSWDWDWAIIWPLLRSSSVLRQHRPRLNVCFSTSTNK